MVGEMRKLRWVMESAEYWDLDMSTPLTLHGVARPAPVTCQTVGGGSRGSRLSRHKQVDFFQRFMAAPFVPSYSSHNSGFSLQRLLTLTSQSNWFTALLGDFNVQKFVSSIRTNESTPQPSESSWLKAIGTKLSDKSLYALNLCSELLLTPDDTLVLSIEHNGSSKDTYRKKALLHHKFLNHNLTVEAAWPELYVDHLGNYWNVPFSLAVDLASVASNVGAGYHFSINHNQGTPTQHKSQVTSEEPATIRPGLCAKGVFALKRSIDIWRSNSPKLKLVQPYDICLSTPHISASGIVGAILTACRGGNRVTSQADEKSEDFKGCFTVRSQGVNSSISADTFASLIFSAQHGNFQRLFLDLTRVHGRLDFPSGLKLLSNASLVAQDLYNSNQPSVEVLQAICPKATVSLQQQIGGPFSFRVDSGVSLDLKKSSDGPKIRVNDPVFAIEYALQVLGSAKAVAWYSPNQQEFMIELRFFET